VKTFAWTWFLGGLGFAVVELVTRPPAAGGIGVGFGGWGRLREPAGELVHLDDVFRADLDNAGRTPEVRVPPRSLCLSPCCHGKSSAAAGAAVAG
jgi:hypothetical protein